MSKLIFSALCALVWATPLFGESTNPVDGSEFIVGDRNYLLGYPAIVADDIVNVVIEIPAGSNQKWEVSADGKTIHWEITDEGPRTIQYLPYPGNYGMIPRTILTKNSGGDGDPLDVILISEAQKRGSIVQARPIAVLNLLDHGEVDDKILAVPMTGPMSHITDLESLNRNFPGISEILETWFTNYKGIGGLTESLGFADACDAKALIREAAAVFEEKMQSATQ